MKPGGPCIAADFANFAGYIEPETVMAWKKAGIDMAIIRASIEDVNKAAITRHQLKVCHEAGLRLALYGWLYWEEGPEPAEQVKSQLLLGEGYPVERLWLDCEEASPFGPAETVGMIAQAVQAATDAGVEVGLYSRRLWWQQYTANSTAFAHLPLWDADPVGYIGLPAFVPYGRWAARAGHQYAFDVVLGGVAVDLSVFEV